MSYPDLPILVSDVTPIIPNTVLASPAISVCISAADALVKDLLNGTSLSSATKFEVERFLAAHFANIADPSLTGKAAKKVEGLEIEYANARATTSIGLGLDYSRYGQQAQMLDWSGTLRRANKLGQMRFKVTHSNRFNANNTGDVDIAFVVQ